MKKGLRPTQRKPGSLPDTRIKEAGDRTTCRDLEHQCDTRRPPRLDRDRDARPSGLSPTTLSSPELKYHQASDEALIALHRSIFTAWSSIYPRDLLRL
ncbi:hypothetical protein HID58_010094 [Brassica napus]|uniref:Uncharacterized protein n=1 Tax=Brassica napus TaxID=3708 RepID=A0ABQ8DV42_BRANA|nr:hypothetical protein HID58_010094 [Brassica napus]